MRISVISISNDRLESFRQKNNIDGFHVYGVDGRLLTAAQYFELGVSRRDKPLTPSEIGCALSHINALKEFLASDDDFLCVLEDDVEINVNNSLSDLRLFLHNEFSKKNEPLLIHLGGQDGLPGRWKIHGEKIGLVGDRNLWKLNIDSIRWLWRTCGYVVNRGMATLMLSKQNESLGLADAWSGFINKSCVCCYCDLVRHDLDLKQSSIEAERKSIIQSGIYKMYISKVHGFALFLFLVLSRYERIHK